MGPVKRPSLIFVLLLLASSSFCQAPVINSFSPTSGTFNSIIHITGSNFTGVTAVSFGFTPASYFYAESDNSIVAYVGQGTTGYVAVSTPSGTAYSPGFTYLPPPSITSFTPASGGYGDTIRIKGTNLSIVSQVHFMDSVAKSFTIFGDTLIKAVLGNGESGSVGLEAGNGIYWAPGFTHLGPAITSFTPTSGTAGNIITINGIHFTGASQVRFGGIPAASYIIQSDNVISATLSSGGPGDVSVKAAFGTATLPGFIIPTIQWFTPNSGTRGDIVSITGTNFTGVSSVMFGDSAARSFTIVNDGQINATVGDGETGELRIIKGASNVFVGNFYYLPYWPHITSFAPTSGAIGATIIIHGDHFLGASDVYFGSVHAASFTVVSDTEIDAVVANGSSGSVSVVNNNEEDDMAGFTFIFTPPVITAVSPATAPIGTTVTITGHDFGPGAADNIVYFGSVKANIISANTTSISVAVPTGSDYMPISVTHNSLTGYSPRPFDVSFNGAPAAFFDSSFASQIKYRTTGSNPWRVIQGDFDGDGKPDLAVVYWFFGTTNNIVSVYRNISNGSNIDLAAPLNFNIGTQSDNGYDIACADIDGDGKLDIIVTSSGDNLASVLKNTSTAGNISFAPKADFITGSNIGPQGTSPTNLTVSDFDGDGKPDLAFANFGLDNWCKVSYMRNTTMGGIISFAPKNDYPIEDAYNVFSTDLNNDNKPDIAVGIYVNGSFMKQCTTLNNNGAQGNISFQRNDDFGASNSYRTGYIAYADLDGDGKTDLVVCNENSNTISLFRNTSTAGGLITFDNYTSITVGSYAADAYVSDVDGDGKADIVVSVNNGNAVSVLKNISTPGNILFAPKVDYATGVSPHGVITADLDGDGKPEIITANSGDTSISILRNKAGEILRLCPPNASTTLLSTITGSSYQWQLNTGSGFNNISNNSNYSGVTTATLQLNNLPASFNGYLYRCYVNASSYSNQYKVQFVNKWTGAVSSLWDNPGNWSCGVLPDGNTDVVIETGPVTLNVNGICSSIKLSPGVVFHINTGVTLTITH